LPFGWRRFNTADNSGFKDSTKRGLLSSQRANERIERQVDLANRQIDLAERNSELWERQVEALATMAQRLDEIVQLMRQQEQPSKSTENLEQITSLSRRS
jgi:LPS O-antigen subunit length determinant protein (WzzB/FepE family)